MGCLINNFIKEIDILRKKVNDYYFIINKNYHEIANQKMEQKFEEDLQIPSHYDQDIDYDQFVDDAIDFGVEEYSILKLMNYRNIANWICCAIELCEQQLYVYAKELDHTITPSQNWFDTIINILTERYDYNIKLSEEYLNLESKRMLVNVLKHGEGKSEIKLRQIKPQYFITSNTFDNYDVMQLYNSSLTEVALNIDESDFNETCDQIISFWEYVKNLND